MGGGETDLRIAFKVFQSTIQSPNAAEIRIYNPSQATAKQFQGKQGKKVTLTAGYQDNSGPIYIGEIKQSFIRKEDQVTTVLLLFCATADGAYNQGRVDTTVSAGHTPQDRVDAAVKAMAPFGVSLGLVNVDLSQPKYPRGIPLVGMARDVLRGVALSAGALWSIQDGNQVHIVKNGNSVPGPAFVLNSQTGMIGFPEQTEDGIIVRSLINPALKINSLVQINQASIQQATPDYAGIASDASKTNFNLSNTGTIAADGMYRVLFIERSGDTRGQEWYDTSTVLAAAGAFPNEGQLSAGAVPFVSQS
jgi:hypothetical protein